jgi:arylsulfatase A-like enzyme
MMSRYPGQIGLKKLKNRLPETVPLLSTRMKNAGYRTAAVVTNPYLAPVFGFSRDFDDYILLPESSRADERPRKIPRGRFSRTADAGVVTDRALRWLTRHGGGRYFLWVHYMDPHIPYRSLKGELPGTAEDVRREVRDFLRDPVMMHRLCGEADLSGGAKALIRRLYREDIAFFDRCLGRLLAGVRDRFESGTLLLIFTSDHGEEFWEHGCFEHGHTLYDELLTVPLIIARPGSLPEDREVRRQVGLVDIVPTVLQLCGLDVPGGLAGKSLLPFSGDEGSGRTVLSEGLLWGGDLRSLRSDRYKVIYDPASGTGRAFDLKKDPGERAPLRPGDQPGTARLLEEMIRMMESHEKDLPPEALEGRSAADPLLEDPETRRRLEALGYLPEDGETPAASGKEDDFDRRGDTHEEDELPHP